MKLWIRSQDRKVLGSFGDIAIKTSSEDGKSIRGYEIVGYFDKNTEYETLGEYATKERALEVLDEIDEFVDLLNNNLLGLSRDGIHREHSVYEMPEE